MNGLIKQKSSSKWKSSEKTYKLLLRFGFAFSGFVSGLGFFGLHFRYSGGSRNILCRGRSFGGGRLGLIHPFNDGHAGGIAAAVIEFTRGVPTLLLIYFFFLVLPRMGVNLGAFWRITLPCAISASGIIAEAFRAGVNAVPKGQTEAALSLGLSNARTFYQVVFPQALRFVIPSLISELVIVLKDTTFAYVVCYADVMQHAKVLITSHDALVSVYLVVAVIYILINYALNRLSDRFARGNRLSNVQRQGETA